jgi:hypothetical protein
MATSSIHTIIRNMLDEKAEDLKRDLHLLEAQMKHEKSGMFITHNGEDSLIVYAAAKYKAYIPKRYDSWAVQFVEWNGEEIPLDMDAELPTF